MGDRIAKTEKYTPQQKEAMIQAYDAGGRNLAARFGLNISEASAQHNVRNWKKNLEERGHLENFVRGVAPGSKFCFDGEELEVIKRAKELFPDMYLDELVHWVKAQGYRYV
jgi:transposase-like protein